MDPRRPRDPRLPSRVDPRLNRADTPPVNQEFDLPTAPHTAQNSIISTPPLPSKPVKTKPLFCVVCASNQVCMRKDFHEVFVTQKVPEPFYGRP